MKATIRFSKNWNRKLNGQFFSSFRLPCSKYTPGNTLNVYCQDVYIFDAKVIQSTEVMLKYLTEYDTRLDAGLCRLDFIIMMKRMYPAIDFDKQPMVRVLFECIGHDDSVVGKAKPIHTDYTVSDFTSKKYVQTSLNL